MRTDCGTPTEHAVACRRAPPLYVFAPLREPSWQMGRWRRLRCYERPLVHIVQAIGGTSRSKFRSRRSGLFWAQTDSALVRAAHHGVRAKHQLR